MNDLIVHSALVPVQEARVTAIFFLLEDNPPPTSRPQITSTSRELTNRNSKQIPGRQHTNQ